MNRRELLQALGSLCAMPSILKGKPPKKTVQGYGATLESPSLGKMRLPLDYSQFSQGTQAASKKPVRPQRRGGKSRTAYLYVGRECVFEIASVSGVNTGIRIAPWTEPRQNPAWAGWPEYTDDGSRNITLTGTFTGGGSSKAQELICGAEMVDFLVVYGRDRISFRGWITAYSCSLGVRGRRWHTDNPGGLDELTIQTAASR